MGIYIKGMKMPKNCFECPCYHRRRDVGYYDYELCDASGTIFNDSYSSVTGHKDRINPFEEKLSNCPLVEIPAHGDLIDVDALQQDWLENGENEYIYNTNSFLDSLNNTSIIIPAEENG